MLNDVRRRADAPPVNTNELVLVQGMAATKATLAEWNRNPWGTLRVWLGWSLLTAVGLLVAVYVVARMSTPDATRLIIPGVQREATFDDVGHVLLKNSLVLALHGMACVAGFLAGSAVPQQAQFKTGINKWVHEKAGPFAIAFVVCATTFSLCTQAYVIGNATSTVADNLGISELQLLLALSIHAIPELTALFLPLAAWVVASRAGEWEKLLAATVVTVGLAIPVLLVSCFVEVYVTPHVISDLAGF
jgi:Stage II sporulation protein M